MASKGYKRSRQSTILRCAALIAAPTLLVACTVCMSQYQANSPRLRRSLRKALSSSVVPDIVYGDSHRMPEVISQELPHCKENAVVYFANKHRDSVNQRDTYGNLVRSLDFLYDNYLNENGNNTNVFLFHLGDFDTNDLQHLEWRYNSSARIQLVNLAHSRYWQLPKEVEGDDMSQWKGHEDLNERHLKRWNSILIWDFFDDLNQQHGCSYQHIMRLDPDSFVYSPIQYNVFDFMSFQGYQYGYRLCSYESSPYETPAQHVWKEFKQSHSSATIAAKREEPRTCTVANSFYVANLQFFLSQNVQSLLRFVDRGGYLYRHRLQDYHVHNMAIHAFAKDSAHRFLDFTYEHFTKFPKTSCPKEGAIQAGYNDPDAEWNMSEWSYVYLQRRNCPIGPRGTRIHQLDATDLSPHDSHLTAEIAQQVSLLSISAGNTERHHRHLKEDDSMTMQRT